MAYTKVFAIRARLDDRVKYAVNGEKTELDERIVYTADPEKTDRVTSKINRSYLSSSDKYCFASHTVRATSTSNSFFFKE